MAFMFSALDEKEWQAERRRLKDEAHKQLKEGQRLNALRIKRGRKFDDMSATEQQTLQDFDTVKTRKACSNICITKPSRVRSEML